ncbi:hypothetical protein A3860_01860 [Niastella vici]|uniref:Uncharacterized protein n=1 Tax=Niastella vici TaxID=1703345 RepID=A0A1V9G982_9BACT|nr:hypothetical protein A3860_01860 [Niastella vici]
MNNTRYRIQTTRQGAVVIADFEISRFWDLPGFEIFDKSQKSLNTEISKYPAFCLLPVTPTTTNNTR